MSSIPSTPSSEKLFQAQRQYQHRSLPARVMQFETAHGCITTPCFMPVGTKAYVNHMTAQDLKECGSQIILGGNTYHMLCTPGLQRIQASGGMHRMMGWTGPMLTDSGGYQVLSLSRNSQICRINDQGAEFKHPDNGEVIKLDATRSIAAQKVIGADIIMAFDQCTPEQGAREAAEQALERTHRWLEESIQAHKQNTLSVYGQPQALFGIIQGGRYQDLRLQSMEFVVQQPLDGLAIGGEVIGFDMQATSQILSWLTPHLPVERLRYTMGVGLNPQDLIDVVAEGIDLFDCVAPTRNARHGALYHGHPQTTADGRWVYFDSCSQSKDRILIKKSQYACDENPILEGCTCQTCRNHSRAYLHYLFKSKSPLFAQLACVHNVHVMHNVCHALKSCIAQHS